MPNNFNTRARGDWQLHFKMRKWASWSCPDGGQFEGHCKQSSWALKVFFQQSSRISSNQQYEGTSLFCLQNHVLLSLRYSSYIFLKADENNCRCYYYVQKRLRKKIKVAYAGTQKLENNGITVALTTFPSPSPAPSLIPGNGWGTSLKLCKIIK